MDLSPIQSIHPQAGRFKSFITRCRRIEHQDAPHPDFRTQPRCHTRMVRLYSATGDRQLRPVRLRLRQQILQLPNLVATKSRPEPVITLHQYSRGSAKRRTQPRQLLDRRLPMTQRQPRYRRQSLDRTRPQLIIHHCRILPPTISPNEDESPLCDSTPNLPTPGHLTPGKWPVTLPL